MMTLTEQRTCPGHHTDTSPAPGLRDDEYLCRRCVDRAMHYLRDMLSDLSELDRTATRQAVLGGSSRRPKNDEQPLPFHPTAADRRAQIDGWLYEWAWFVADRRGRPLARIDRSRVHVTRKSGDAPPRVESAQLTRVERVTAVKALLESRDWLRSDEQGPGLAEMIAAARASARATVDRYEHRWYAGPCGAPAERIVLAYAGDGELSLDVRSRPCEFDLYAEPGKSVVVCDGYRDPDGLSGCGAFHPVHTRRLQLIESLRDELLPLDLILPAMRTLVGANPSPELVRQWRRRKRLIPEVCRVSDRVELYRGGDVLDLVLDEKPRTGPKRSDRPAGDTPSTDLPGADTTLG